MGFIAHALEQFQRSRLMRETQWLFDAGPVNLLEFLGKTDDRDMTQAQFFQLNASSMELPFAAIDQDQVRQRRLLAFGQLAGRAMGSQVRYSRIGSRRYGPLASRRGAYIIDEPLQLGRHGLTMGMVGSVGRCGRGSVGAWERGSVG